MQEEVVEIVLGGDGGVELIGGGAAGAAADAPAGAAEMGEGEIEPMLFAGKKKKKKRRKEPTFLADIDEATAPVVETTDGASGEAVARGEEERVIITPETIDGEWQEHEYSNLLERVYAKMRKREGVAGGDGPGGGRSRFVVVPPQVIKLGSKKSAFANFSKVCEQIGRDPLHIKRYLEVELGSTGTLDGQGFLVFRGKFGRGEMEAVLGKYIREYVRCKTCRGYSTRLERDKATRLTFLVCDGCSARSTTGNIEDGFSALTEKRSRIRRREGN